MVRRSLTSMGRKELLAELTERRARDAEQTAQYDALMELVEHPPAPTPALVQLMREAREQNPDGFRSREELLAELAERRRQPVLTRCGECSSMRMREEYNEETGAYFDVRKSEHCGRDEERRSVLPLLSEDLEHYLPPPAWCPARGTP